MNPLYVIFSLIGFLFLAFSFRILSLTVLGDFILVHPWWVYLVIVGIISSGYMAYKSYIEEQKSGKAPIYKIYGSQAFLDKISKHNLIRK